MSAELSYLVNEIYPCLQGEGTNMGRPSVLVRLQICNLRCTWCDTPYTHTMKSDPVDPSQMNSPQGFKRWAMQQLCAEIRAHTSNRHIIFSGGEPTLQNLAPLFEELKSSHSIEVETNGTQIPHQLHHSFELQHYSGVQWNVSPKGRNAGQKINPEALTHWGHLAANHPAVYFKFVIRKSHIDDDLNEILELKNNHLLPDQRIILMAEGTSLESQIQNAWLEDICLKQGWMLSPRLHVLNHGPKRGV